MKKEIGNELILASNNKGKVAELEKMLAPCNIKIRTAGEFPELQDPEETGETFLENAKIKALYYAKHTGLPALADDSGLCVEGLDNRPGVYTARFAPTHKEGMERINAELGDNENRKAHFACCLVLAFPDGEFYNFDGFVHGTIAKEPMGDKGFAYDPIFIPEGYDITFAQMEPEEKAKHSHRGNALRLFASEMLSDK